MLLLNTVVVLKTEKAVVDVFRVNQGLHFINYTVKVAKCIQPPIVITLHRSHLLKITKLLLQYWILLSNGS